MANNRLSRIETQWSVVRQAHDPQRSSSGAQEKLIDQYGPAIKRYLLASMKNEDAAAEVFQEFALRLVRGDFRNADSEKGSFRNMLKTALYRLMVDFHRRAKKHQGQVVDLEVEQVAALDSEPQSDAFSLAWRQSLLDEAWNRLEQLQEQSGKPYYTVLRTRVDQPLLTTKQLYVALADKCESLVPEPNFRVFVHRARKRFAAILTEQVAHSLKAPTQEDIELELIQLGLHHYCKN